MKYIAFILFIYVCCYADNDWPQWRGQNADGISQTKSSLFDGKPGIVWKKKLGSGYSSISIYKNFAITMYSDGKFDYVIALDAFSGEQIWQYKIDQTYFGHDGSHDGPISTPTIHQEKVFVLAPKGQLVVLEISTGKLLWQKHLAADKNAKVPFYGFGTSPVACDNKVFVQAGENNQTISAFDISNGETLWSAGTDSVNYQVPFIKGKTVISVGDQYISGFDIESGNVQWEFHHQGRGIYNMPVVVDYNNGWFFFQYKSSESMLLQIQEDGIEKKWTTRAISQSYAPAMYQNQYLYGYSGRFLTCIDIVSGKKMWKSRKPGDGFSIMVNHHLVTMTKEGSLHVAPASCDSYNELYNLQVFHNDLVWTPPSFANDCVYVRSLGEIACISFSQANEIAVDQNTSEQQNDSPFNRFLQVFEDAENKQEIVKKFFETYQRFPIIEDKFVHFVYHGEAREMAIESDIIGFRNDHAMKRIAGTDIFYYSVPIEQNARVQYRFIKNLEEYLVDPFNNNSTQQMSCLEMPQWKAALHLTLEQEQQGLLAPIEIVQDTFQRKVQVYLPAEYQTQQQKSFPVVYIHGGSEAIEEGLWVHTLENLILQNKIIPVIAVFIPEERGEYFQEQSRIIYMENFTRYIIPYIDMNFRTQQKRESRINYGAGSAGVTALFCTLRNPEIFLGSASQSAFLLTTENAQLEKIIPSLEYPITFYVEWGKYDLRSPLEGWSILNSNRFFAELLNKQNIVFYGGELPIGFDWVSWRNQTDKILTTFFTPQND